MHTISRGAARSTIIIKNCGLATALITGVVVPDTALAISTGSADAAVSSAARGIVYRLEQSVVCYGLDQMPKHDQFTAAGQAMPAALVVTEATHTMFAEYCRRAGAKGMIRRAFTDAERAEAWLRAQAEMLRVSMAMRLDPARRKPPCTQP
jgi:hypothetical protein